MDPTKPILSYADRGTDASFQCSENMIFIFNSNGKEHRYIVWACATFLVVIPFLSLLLPNTTWFAFDEPGVAGWIGLLVYIATIFACISAGFWWSTVRVDLVTRHIELTSRWGPFRTHTVAPLTAFEEVKLEHDSDGDINVELVGSQGMRIVWGRDVGESIRIAKEFAARVSLPLGGRIADHLDMGSG